MLTQGIDNDFKILEIYQNVDVFRGNLQYSLYDLTISIRFPLSAFLIHILNLLLQNFMST